MYKEIFDNNLDIVCEMYAVKKKDIFTKTKKRPVSEARYALYYLCDKAGMRKVYIQSFMQANKYIIGHSNIIQGIEAVKDRIKKEPMFKAAFENYNKQV